MIARTWKGWTAREDADSYVEYLRKTGVAEYRNTPGNKGVFLLRRLSEDRAEFLLVSLWESMDAVRRFAGQNPDRAVFYPDDDRFLIGREDHVTHYDVIGPDDESGTWRAW
ncbi:MAG: antibiotic biosynthesis monooxygenase [Gemmatimonadetes bacterium]|nr:antibiotic biosynthesis monooxygenase [Gemmatimonadota bacterium]